jgi:hypothetical protein
MTVSVNDLVRVVVSYSSPNASIAQNVFLYRMQAPAGTDIDVLTDVKDYFIAQHLDNWADLAAEDSRAFLIEMDILSLFGLVVRNLGEFDLDVPGTRVSEPASAAVSAYNQVTTTRTRSVIKKYWPFIAELIVENGALGGSGIALMALILLDMLDGIDITGGGHLEPGIRSTVDDTFYPIIQAGYVTDIMAYQRRRKPGVGS